MATAEAFGRARKRGLGRDRVGDWMETYSGLRFWPLDPVAEEVLPIDIAHHLSMICRYNGASRFHYSVGQHSVLLCDYVRRTTGDDGKARIALLHDAAEAYFGDVVRPTKHDPAVARVLEPIERAIERAVYTRFNMPAEADLGKPNWMKVLEVRMSLDERGALMQNGFKNHWAFADGAEPLGLEIEPWSTSRSYGEFMSRLRRFFPNWLLGAGFHERDPTDGA